MVLKKVSKKPKPIPATDIKIKPKITFDNNYLELAGNTFRSMGVDTAENRVGYVVADWSDPHIVKSKGRSKSSKSILFLSDMHVGSYLAVCSPEPVIKDTSIKPTKLQEKLYEHWCEVRDSIQAKKLHCLVVNGEPIDGDNKREVGLDAWTTDQGYQIDDAVKLLKMFKTNSFVLTRGSGYHVKSGAKSHEDEVAKALNAVPYSVYGNVGKVTEKIKGWHDDKHLSTRTDHHLTLEVNGKVFSITHHIAFTRWFNYQPMALAREMANMEYLRGKYWTDEDFPTFIVRSHVHYYVQVRFSSTTGFTTPAWKFPDSYLYRGGLSGTAPSIGGIEVIIEPNGKSQVEPYLMSEEKYPKMSILRL